MDPVDQFAANLRRLREERGMTQEQLAHAADLIPTDIGKLESQRRQPGLIVIAKLARGLGVDPGELFYGVKP